ncbi:MAG: dihydroorotate dehydrogenase-like protein [Acidimicrobiales bacterium]
MAADLTTRYLGLELSSPVVASASPLNDDVEMVRALAEAGAAAVVMPSLFEEEILQEELELTGALEAGSEHVAEALEYFPSVTEFSNAADRYVERLGELKEVVRVPVIASLNAASPGGWVRYATCLADAGADAVELNLYTVAADSERSSAEVEDELLEVVREVRAVVGVPLAVKLSPYFSSMANVARRMAAAGADGLVLFNRFYQPDLDLEALEVVPRVELSSPWELRLPLRWIAILRPVLPDTSLAATSGIASGIDVAKAIAVGADVAMMTSAVLRHGPDHIATVIEDLQRWLDGHDYASVAQLRGSMSSAACADPSAFERANYRQVLHSWVSPSEPPPTPPPSSS